MRAARRTTAMKRARVLAGVLGLSVVGHAAMGIVLDRVPWTRAEVEPVICIIEHHPAAFAEEPILFPDCGGPAPWDDSVLSELTDLPLPPTTDQRLDRLPPDHKIPWASTRPEIPARDRIPATAFLTLGCLLHFQCELLQTIPLRKREMENP